MTTIRATILTRRRLWLVSGLTASAVALSVLLSSITGAQEASQAGDPRVIDPDDRCSTDAPPAPFSDRDQIAEVHRASVDCAFAKAITRGHSTTTYAPRMAVRRDQMASFIVRTLQAAGGIDIPAPSDQGFTDISGNTHEDAINQLAALGVTRGRTATQYAPAETVRRDQMASFILRAANVAFDTTFEATGGPHFADVPATNVHGDNIDAGFELFGLTVGQAPNTFVPDRGVRRDQMATFLIRLLDVTELTDEAADGVAGASLVPGLDIPDTATEPLADTGVTQEPALRDTPDLLEGPGLPQSPAALPGGTNDPVGRTQDPAGTDDPTGRSDPATAPDDDTDRSGVGGLVDRITG